MLLRDRKTPRAKWHDYKGGEYFVTICTKDRVHFFGEVYGGEMRMTSIGKMLKQEIEKTEKIRGGEVSIPLYVIMPNHVHLIVVVFCRDASHASGSGAKMDACDASLQGQEADRMDRIQQGQEFGPQSKNLGSVIRGIKSAVTRFANENNIPFAWQSRYHDHIVRNQDEMNRIAEYIETNPIRWESDCFYR
ncbi:MAG: transposase [Paludibacteraceae bacterium]|nr:transposase [Paludibacteraceae bacterium]